MQDPFEARRPDHRRLPRHWYCIALGLASRRQRRDRVSQNERRAGRGRKMSVMPEARPLHSRQTCRARSKLRACSMRRARIGALTSSVASAADILENHCECPRRITTHLRTTPRRLLHPKKPPAASRRWPHHRLLHGEAPRCPSRAALISARRSVEQFVAPWRGTRRAGH